MAATRRPPSAATADDPGPDSLAAYAREVSRAAATKEAELRVLRDTRDRTNAVAGLLSTLPARLSHPVMVPLGRHAFFQGSLVHTNELTVHLGGQYYAEMTAPAAREVLSRRVAALDDGVSKAEDALRALTARLQVAGSTLGDLTGGVQDGEDGSGREGEEDSAGPLREIRETEEEAAAWAEEARVTAKAAAAAAAVASTASTQSSGAGSTHGPAVTSAAGLKGSSSSSGGGGGGGTNIGGVETNEDAYWAALMAAEEEAEGLGDEEAEKAAQAAVAAVHARLGISTATPAAPPAAEATSAGGNVQAGGGVATGDAALSRRVSWGTVEAQMAAREAEPDSDDDEDHTHIGAGSGGTAEATASSSSTSSRATGSDSASMAVEAASTSATKPGPKSILKKGFFSSPGRSSTQQQKQKQQPTRPPVTTPSVIGAVVEHPLPGSESHAPAAAVLTERVPATLPAAAAGAAIERSAAAPEAEPSAAPKRMSRFKMQRMGLIPDGDGDGGRQ